MVALTAHDGQFLLFRPPHRDDQPPPSASSATSSGGIRGAPADTMMTSYGACAGQPPLPSNASTTALW